MVDGKAIPTHPWDPAGPALSANIPLLIGYARTEETLYDRPTPEKLALDDAGLRERASKRLGGDPTRAIEAFRNAHPEATPWDLWILMATEHPRGTYARELAKRKADQRAAPAFMYRYDWETPEGGGHMRSPHTIEIPFVFKNIEIAGPLISKMPEAHALADRTSAAWAAFCAYRRSQYAEAAEVAGLLGNRPRDDAVQQRVPGGVRPRPRTASRHGANPGALIASHGGRMSQPGVRAGLRHVLLRAGSRPELSRRPLEHAARVDGERVHLEVPVRQFLGTIQCRDASRGSRAW
jgi:hypothetical protein